MGCRQARRLKELGWERSMRKETEVPGLKG